MNDNTLVNLSRRYAVQVVNICSIIKERGKSNALVNQFIRCGTSIGANIHEANYASSKADFINKLQIALKECYEAEYWIGIFKDTDMITEEEHKELYSKCSKIRIMLISSINTAKENK